MIQLLGIGLLAALFFILQQKIYLKYWNRDLNIDLAFENNTLFEGDEGVLIETIENRKILPLTLLKVKFQTSRNLYFDQGKGSKSTDQYYRNDVFSVSGHEKITRRLPFKAGKRGFYAIQSADIVSSDLFMTRDIVDAKDLYCDIHVYPRLYDSREFRMSLQKLNGSLLAKRRITEDPFEFRGIREYQPTDDLRSVNWKASAKTGELKVNQKNYTSQLSVDVYLNIDDVGILKKTDSLELGIQICAGLCSYFLQSGYQVSCYTNAPDISTGKPFVSHANAGRNQMESILKGLSRVDLGAEPIPFLSLYEEALLKDTDGHLTCFISANHYEDFTAVLEKKARSLADSSDFLWFYPVWEMKDPQIPEVLQKYTQFIHYRK